MPTYRYHSTSINITQLQQVVPGSLALVANGPDMFVDISAPSSSKDDLDEAMTGLGYVFVQTDPPLTPPKGTSQTTVEHMMIVPSVAGKNSYAIPAGNLFLNSAGETQLDLDQGAGFIPQAYGADYGHLLRSAPGTPASVVDAAIGFSLNNAVSAGWTFRFRWKERRILVEPPSIAKVLSSLDYNLYWLPNSANAPDGVLVPSLNGMQVEFWRETRRNGGRRGSADPTKIQRLGRRYLPYFRGATDVFLFNRAAFAVATGPRRKYRVCYYDPTTGARSALSNDIILVNNNQQADRVNGKIGRAHV